MPPHVFFLYYSQTNCQDNKNYVKTNKISENKRLRNDQIEILFIRVHHVDLVANAIYFHHVAHNLVKIILQAIM